MKESLKVTPVLRYNTPKYPAHNEPNPLQIPSKKASKAGFYKTALLSIIGLFSFNNEAEAQTIKSINFQELDSPDTTKSPIKFKELAFPHTYSMFGTGSVIYYTLDRESSIAIIDSVFRANDIDLQKDYNFSQDQLEFKTVGYDPKLCTGYVWLDGENTTPDSSYSLSAFYLKNNLLPKDKEKYQELKRTNVWLKQYSPGSQFLKSLVKKGYYKLILLQKYASNRQNEELQKEIADYLEKNTNKDDVNYGEEIYNKYTNELLNSEEIKAIIGAEDYNIAVFSRYDKCLSYPSDSYELVFFDISEGDDEEHRKLIDKDSLQSVLEKGKIIHKEIQTISHKGKARQNLAIFVQEYIDWAKSEGRF